MRTVLAFALALCATAAVAQTTPTWEVYGKRGATNVTLPGQGLAPHPIAVTLTLAERHEVVRKLHEPG